MLNDDNKILAQYNGQTIRVYQAFRSQIADEAVRLGKFGPHFRLNRMSWVKPSFLWMMYRSGWATKQGQERILAIDMRRSGFNHVLEKAVLTSFSKESYGTYEQWKTMIAKSEVRCQWDPDRDIYGNQINKRTIQLGLSGDVLKKYAKEWIVGITDITDYVIEIGEAIRLKKFEDRMLPAEREYPLDTGRKRLLGIL